MSFGRVSGELSGGPVYVLGGGPSLSGFDFDRLSGPTIAANKTAFIAKSDYLVSLDLNFIRQSRSEISDFISDGGRAILALDPSRAHLIHDEPVPGATYVIKDRTKGLSSDPGRLFGTNSGYAAVNVAYLMGAKDIRLLGLDFSHASGHTHFHGGYSWGTVRTNNAIQKWANEFGHAKPVLDEEGVQITYYVDEFCNPTMQEMFKTCALRDL